MYDIVYTEEARRGLARLRKDEPKAHAKAVKLLQEVLHHPRTGTGHPEPLTGERNEQWSRGTMESKNHEEAPPRL